ncbi:MAG: TIGR00341 family protein [Gammaproteobacteria bacterium]|nr:TIGR00341 family protein [Gammaproteobacteria bacterium]
MKIIEVITHSGNISSVKSIAEQYGAIDQWTAANSDDEERQVVRLLVDDPQRQIIMDALQNILSTNTSSRIVVLPVEVSLPLSESDDKNKDTNKSSSGSSTREELFQSISKNAELNSNFILLVILSTIVAAIGLIENNVAVVIGAMVIAPLLAPNIALALAAALGDIPLMLTSLRTNLAGLTLAFTLSLILGWLLPINLDSHELMSRTYVGLDSVVLALASGAAAVLSLTTGLSSVLVGVMVAVALLPPAATVGLMLGSGEMNLALGAGLLLAVNIVCVNLSAKIVFLLRGIKPRTWLEKRKARQSIIIYIVFWIMTLLVLLIAIYLHGNWYKA